MEFQQGEEFPFPLLSDESRSMGTAYGTARAPDHDYAQWPMRITYLIDPTGTVRGAWEVRDLSTHIGEVLEALQAETAPT